MSEEARVRAMVARLAQLGIEPPEEASPSQALEYQVHELAHADALGVIINNDTNANINAASETLSAALSRLDEILANVVAARVMHHLGVRCPPAAKMSFASLGDNADLISHEVSLDPAVKESVRRVYGIVVPS